MARFLTEVVIEHFRLKEINALEKYLLKAYTFGNPTGGQHD